MQPTANSPEVLAELFQASVLDNQDFQEALEIVRRNTTGGKIWVIGGQVYRTIIAKLDHRPVVQKYDFDFIVERPVEPEKFYVPAGWTLTRTGLGQPRLMNGQKQIDIAALDAAVEISDLGRTGSMTVTEKITSYTRRVPLNIQSLVFDLDEGTIIGPIALEAMKERQLAINNLAEALTFCRRRKRSLYDFLTSRANELGYTSSPPQLSDQIQHETLEFYNRYAEQYSAERGQTENAFLETYLKAMAEKFFASLPGKKILDLGSGPGRDGVILSHRGLDVHCVDASKEMVKLCQSKGLSAQVGDMEYLDVPDGAFDGVWAYCSLVHVPKQRMFNVLARVHEILKPDGVVFVVMVGGQGESAYQSPNKPDKQRFFNLYSHQEFTQELQEYFDVLADTEFTEQGEVFLGFVCLRRELPPYQT